MSSSFIPMERSKSLVEIVENYGEWLVRVVDGDRETVKTFDLEWFANVFAEEEALRLGLQISRPSTDTDFRSGC